jgi:actin related protein 2/3 complex subunit 5
MDPFRKIDIDQYDEDRLDASELYEADPRDPAAVLDEAKQRQAAVRSTLARCVVSRYPVVAVETDGRCVPSYAMFVP